MAYQVGAFGVVDVNEDEAARANGMEAVAVTYLEVAWAKGAFVGGDLGVADVAVGHFDDMVAADLQQEERDVDQVGEEEHLKALNVHEVAVALPE